MKKIVVLFLLLVLVSAGLFVKRKPPITSFEECVAAGNPVQESYPPKCSSPNGGTFTQAVTDVTGDEEPVKLTYPGANQLIRSPLTILGQARGEWYFEGSFPVHVEDESGKVLGRGVAEAQTDWMTEDYVPFTAEVAFTTPTTGLVELVLSKSNPSGLPQNEANLRFPFKLQ